MKKNEAKDFIMRYIERADEALLHHLLLHRRDLTLQAIEGSAVLASSTGVDAVPVEEAAEELCRAMAQKSADDAILSRAEELAKILEDFNDETVVFNASVKIRVPGARSVEYSAEELRHLVNQRRLHRGDAR